MNGRFCNKCGAALAGSAKFCGQCGTGTGGTAESTGHRIWIVVVAALAVLLVGGVGALFLMRDRAPDGTAAAPAPSAGTVPGNETAPAAAPRLASNEPPKSADKPPEKPLFDRDKCSYGPAIDPQFEQLGVDIRAKLAETEKLPEPQRTKVLESTETDSTYRQVAPSPFHGLTVTAIAQHYEATSIFFREPADVVTAKLKAAGYKIDAKGEIHSPASDAEGVSTASISATAEEARRYGASELTCGI